MLPSVDDTQLVHSFAEGLRVDVENCCGKGGTGFYAHISGLPVESDYIKANKDT